MALTARRSALPAALLAALVLMVPVAAAQAAEGAPSGPSAESATSGGLLSVTHKVASTVDHAAAPIAGAPSGAAAAAETTAGAAGAAERLVPPAAPVPGLAHGASSHPASPAGPAASGVTGAIGALAGRGADAVGRIRNVAEPVPSVARGTTGAVTGSVSGTLDRVLAPVAGKAGSLVSAAAQVVGATRSHDPVAGLLGVGRERNTPLGVAGAAEGTSSRVPRLVGVAGPFVSAWLAPQPTVQVPTAAAGTSPPGGGGSSSCSLCVQGALPVRIAAGMPAANGAGGDGTYAPGLEAPAAATAASHSGALGAAPAAPANHFPIPGGGTTPAVGTVAACAGLALLALAWLMIVGVPGIRRRLSGRCELHRLAPVELVLERPG